MSFTINKYNKGSKFIASPEKGVEYAYIKLDKLGKPDKVKALYINDSKFGEQAVAFMGSYFVNLPLHMTSTIKDILSDSEAIDAINAGKVGLVRKVYTSSKDGKEHYTGEWLDM